MCVHSSLSLSLLFDAYLMDVSLRRPASTPTAPVQRVATPIGVIAHGQFVFPIPNVLKSEDAASILCTGLTIFSQLVRNGAGPG
jgi:hypothetical protein